MRLLTLEEGEFAVRYARAVIESHLSGKELILESYPEIFNEKRGCFCTLHTYPERELRGCIGIPEPIMPLIEALREAALGSIRDPRFPPVTLEEMDHIVIEVSILTPPQLIEVSNPKEYLEKIKIGEDGLIIEYGPYRGLLLPQVPVEYGWDVEEFLAHLCLKAGLPPDMWLVEGVKIYKFQAQIFEELEPRGKIVEKKLTGPH
ncbi:AMMECR1 domain protein [Methanocaldococcus infernus ME]|uniref:Protein Metin_0797 n=1 Tax=Methanocaldococcus infernus (strain DSM 11812 / JCM 15783 / ME) TaxID=573063 RepID=D5VSA9_METIM|nr:TIGR00296 family protein [Methanocaldococcus infernus]ADG13462.1 AMMECR1 domain protein [Methanocaldococcus infernus ME]